ncbi:hypothetical protein V8Z80_11855 [Orrella sp. JC864]|uniref:hypothetical protein n=1 Tax=Orrella sp. JC864 TaxID=3120298 RepID=UPI00300AABD7
MSHAPRKAPVADVQAVQFKVLEHVFPVLRHDAVKPISNAKLAAAMLARSMAAADGAGAPDRGQQLVEDIDQLLDDGVDAMRGLGDWFADTGSLEDLHNLLFECRKLLFTHLLLTGKKIQLPEETDTRRIVKVQPSRYVLLAWLLYTLQDMQPGATLQLDYDEAGRLTATVRDDGPAPANAQADAALSVVTAEEARQVASHYGWSIEGNQGGWHASVPMIQ